MIRHPSSLRLSQFATSVVLAASCLALPQVAWSQASAPSEGPNIPTQTQTPMPEAPPAPGVAAKNTAVKVIEESQGSPVNRAIPNNVSTGVRAGLITQVGTGRPVSEGSRVLRSPGKCSPKTGSLDCVAEAGQASNGANVSSRVRNSVIGEVGAGRAATEGSGTVKRKDACTPQPGKLTCE
jgi:hypothetical protein